jgi:glycerol-3-phosphate cytidylyltransferase
MIFNKVKDLKDKGLTIGITFSQFDLLHAGHIAMLAEAKNHCDYLICGLQNNASWDRPQKNAPIQSLVERQIQLSAVRFVDEIVVYNTEKDLEDILLTLPLDVRILGVEYMQSEFTGRAICEKRKIQLVFNGRDHSFSSTNLRERVWQAENTKRYSEK